MKNIFVIYSGDDWEEKVPLKDSPATKISFEDWHERGLKKNIAFFRAEIRWYDAKNNLFKKAWAYRNKKWIKIAEPIKPDLIFDKLPGEEDYAMFNYKLKISRSVKIFNHPLFRTLYDNKLAQYQTLSEFMPLSFLATNKKEFLKTLDRISSEKVVIKPLYGSGGKGIIITTKLKTGKLNFAYPVIVQKFVTSQNGVPGFSKKREISDLRMVFINHKFIYALSRIAKKGSLFTNFHQGATAILVPQKLIPESAKELSKKIVKKLNLFLETNYSLDFIFTNSGKPLLLEVNTTPGIDLLYIVGTEKIKEKYFSEIIKILD